MRVLVVDDEPDILDSVSTFLGLLPGTTVVTATSAAEALERLAAGGGIDLLLTDFRMPKMTGCELIRELRVRWPDLPAVVMTAYGQAVVSRAECEELGIRRVIDKPPAPATLAEVVKDTAAGVRR